MKNRHTMGQDWGGRKPLNPLDCPKVTAKQVIAKAQDYGIEIFRGGFFSDGSSYPSSQGPWWYKDRQGNWLVLQNTNYLALTALEGLRPPTSELPRELSYSVLFHGYRSPESWGCVTFVGGYKTGSSDWKYLPLHLEIYSHSPTGFNWGYYGSGPAQLALAILYETLKIFYPEAKEEALRKSADLHHQSFKFDFMPGHIQADDWYLDGSLVLDWLRSKAPDFERLLLERE